MNKKNIFIVSIILIFIFDIFYIINYDIFSFEKINYNIFNNNFYLNKNYFLKSLRISSINISLSILSVFIASIFSLIFSFFASKLFNFNFLFFNIIKFFRTLPDLLISIIIIKLNSPGFIFSFYGIFLLNFFSFSFFITNFINNYDFDKLKKINKKYFYFIFLFKESNLILKQSLIRFENNFRNSLTIGLIGGVGLGQEIRNNLIYFNFNNLFINLCVIIFLIFFINFILNLLRRKK